MFLKDFEKRMKKVGVYALIIRNTISKQRWKNFHFEEDYEAINFVFAVLLFIMEESLKDEICTIDDIAAFIDDVNNRSFKKPLTYEECVKLADFVVNTVLCDDGKTMYFQGFNFEENEYEDIHISFLENKIVYVDNTIRRVSYRLSNDGYNLMLSTLEIENNLSITIQEIIFKEHLKKAEYKKAVDDIKNMFNLIRIQIQKMNDAVRRIRQNVLNYSVEEYKDLLNENIESLDSIRTKLFYHRDSIEENIADLNEKNINVKKLDQKERENLKNLNEIQRYINSSLDEQQKLLGAHFDFKSVYSKQLEEMTTMSIIKRYNIQTDLYDKVLDDSSKLDNLDNVLRPLFISKPDKIYNINKCLQYQRAIKKEDIESDEEIEFDEEEYSREKELKKREKLKKYETCIKTILEFFKENKKISLEDISFAANKDENLKRNLIPNIEIFREVVINFLSSRAIDINALKEEKNKSIYDSEDYEFNLSEMILNIVENDIDLSFIENIRIYKNEENKKVKFYEVETDDKFIKVLNCSDIVFECD